MTLAYVDASALAKLVLDERHAGAMRRWYVESDEIAISIVGLIEARRAVARKIEASERVDRIFQSVITVHVDEAVTRVAASLTPATLRTLDTIHLASAIGLLGQLDAFVTYDDRLAEAARTLGLPVVRPA